jgi:O-antigen/teichoic acid export membrane protein
MFGFAQQVADLMERYLPAQMFVGLIRPVLTARFSSGNGFEELVKVCNMVLKLNLFLIGGAAVCLFAGGEAFIYTVIGDKNFNGIVPLLMLICLMVSLYSWRHILDMVTHTVERNGPLIVAHGIMNLSVIPGFLLMPHWGVFALPVSHVVGVFVGCCALLAGLARAGYRFKHDLSGFARLALSLLGAFALSWLLVDHVPWLGRMLICGLFYIILNVVFQTVQKTELSDIKGMLGKRGVSNPAPQAA